MLSNKAFERVKKVRFEVQIQPDIRKLKILKYFVGISIISDATARCDGTMPKSSPLEKLAIFELSYRPSFKPEITMFREWIKDCAGDV